MSVLRRALALWALLHLASCAAGGAAAFAQTQTLPGGTATLSMAEYPPPTMRRTTLRLALSDVQGRPLAGARVCLDLDMPDCPAMPLNRPQAVEVAPGTYEAAALFAMAGYWQVRVEVEGEGEAGVHVLPQGQVGWSAGQRPGLSAPWALSSDSARQQVKALKRQPRTGGRRSEQ
ncbi:MAG TPA: FixH family protein [Anaerolineae bacterium]|nr:FixH family protein [Anaerolineae bacterium]HOQ97411.1 FixH family protein [Anaerolineae bacterium]